ncbi:hypothetical protein ACFRJ9_15940 [Paenarthrobacter sp. NPDC056912]|uniref:hypothetical protein n=1 Tax=Paenarthrobacter sp. NPDC056912 TaxID=3345965 RepID=UPI00366CE301
MTTHAFGRENAKHAAPISLKWLRPLTIQGRRSETFSDYVNRVDAVLDSPEIIAKARALKPARKLPRR